MLIVDGWSKNSEQYVGFWKLISCIIILDSFFHASIFHVTLNAYTLTRQKH